MAAVVRILICDDIANRASSWRDAIEGATSSRNGLEIVVVEQDDLVADIGSIIERRHIARRAAEPDAPSDVVVPASTAFDNADIVVLDYDLFWLGEGSDIAPPLRVTGENLAYLVRCFSRAGYIIALNQFGENYFDLNLRGHMSSYADLNVGSAQIGNPGLWGEDAKGFRPWVWPDVFEAAAQQRRREAWLGDHMQDGVLRAFGFLDSQDAPLIDREILEFFGPCDPRTATFEDVVNSGRPRGLDSTDRAWEPEAVARIAASRMSKWLDREVLSGQEVLVDAPHLVERYPSLLPEGVSREALDLTSRIPTQASEALGINDQLLASVRFEPRFWVSRACWRGHALMADRAVDEIRDPWSASDLGFHFCEDVSRFLLPDQILTYSADVTSSFRSRSVLGPVGVARDPDVVEGVRDAPHSVIGVQYVPPGILEA